MVIIKGRSYDIMIEGIMIISSDRSSGVIMKLQIDSR
jgi:hypothetical protein